MENTRITKKDPMPDHLPPEKLKRLYQRHKQGALVQAGAIVSLWLFLFIAHLFALIDRTSFLGVSVAGAFLIVVNIPFLWGLKQITNRRRFEVYNLSINIVEAIGDTVIIYFLGGIKGMYLILIYGGLVAYVGVSAPKRYPFIIATVCAVSFAIMGVMEQIGLLPHQNNAWGGYYYSFSDVILIVICFAATLYVLAFIVAYTADILKRTKAELRRQNAQLEKSKEAINKAVDALRDRNTILQESLEKLRETQDQLIESEKMAALGGLVAGVAHEINTPVGVGVTAASFLEDRTNTLAKKIADGAMSDDDVAAYVENVSTATGTILKNLQRAAELVKNFKQVAVDQASEVQRRFNFKEYIEGVVLSLRFQYKRTGHKITVKCPDSLEVVSYPGLFSQIVTNLLMNSMIHGLEDVANGEIVFDVSKVTDHIIIQYSDNGKGMEAVTAQHVFEPFFTTKGAQGGSGLGMNIVYNIVTQTLGGRIHCRTAPGEGVVFTIRLPLTRNVLELAQDHNPLA